MIIDPSEVRPGDIIQVSGDVYTSETPVTHIKNDSGTYTFIGAEDGYSVIISRIPATNPHGLTIELIDRPSIDEPTDTGAILLVTPKHSPTGQYDIHYAVRVTGDFTWYVIEHGTHALLYPTWEDLRKDFHVIRAGTTT